MHPGGPATTSWLPWCIPGLFEPDECAELTRAMDASHQQQVEIWLGDDYGVDPASRLGTIADLPDDLHAFVLARVWEVMTRLEAQFGCEISHLSAITALVYRRGDHFAAHADGGIDDDAPDEVRRRRISLVVTLNDGEGDDDEPDFTGGELNFYPAGLAAEPGRPPEQVISVRSRPGLLTAFPSPMFHQVMPVVDGCRYSLALWALAPPG